MNRTAITIVASVFALSGCGTAPERPETPAQFRAMSDRFYSKTPEQIFDAAKKVIRLADDDEFDVSFFYEEDQIHIQRKFYVFMVINTMFATYDFTLRTAPVEGGTRTTLKIELDASLTRGHGSRSQWNYPGLYELFYSRLEYMLGVGDEWLDCEKAKIVFKGKGPLEGLCMMAEDNRPTSLSP